MTLKEKFKQWLDTKPNVIFRDTQCEIIADDYAIEFADWFLSTRFESSGKYLDKTDLQLLEIFKKEKGL
jgi:hypothetical protein